MSSSSTNAGKHSGSTPQNKTPPKPATPKASSSSSVPSTNNPNHPTKPPISPAVVSSSHIQKRSSQHLSGSSSSSKKLKSGGSGSASVSATHQSHPIHRTELCYNEEFDSTLIDWIANLGVSPLNTFRPPRCKNDITILRDMFKKPIRELVTVFFDIHESKRCISEKTYDPNNIGMVRNKLMFKKIYIESHTESRCQQDSTRLRTFILKIFFPGIDHLLPKLTTEWLSLFLYPKVCERRALINDHIALMSERSMRNCIVQWSDLSHQLNLGDYRAYLGICRSLPLYSTWSKRVKNGYALEEVYNGGVYRSKDNDQLLFLRHFFAHFLEYCRQGRRMHKETIFFTYDDGLDMLLSEFEHTIAVLPLHLDNESLLEQFRPHKYFDY